MADRMTPEALKTLLASKAQFAFIDVREAGEYNSSHIPGSSLMSRRHLEFQLPLAVPYKDTHRVGQQCAQQRFWRKSRSGKPRA